jgi:peroxiredoxin
MVRAEQVSIDVRDVGLLLPDGGELPLGQLPGVHVVVLFRHRHCLACQQHLVAVQERLDNPWVGLLLVGFSPPDRLAAIARHLGFDGMVLSDPGRQLYHRLGVGRAPLWRLYTPGTLAI